MDGVPGPDHPIAREAIADAAAALRSGELVAFPTETVYGLGANALDPEAVARIYAAKGRPAWNPVIAHVASIEAAQALAREWPPVAEALARAFWPGPLTLVVPKAPHVPAIVTAGHDAVALRVPAHPVALALVAAAGVPIAAPSANRFTQISPTTAAHVRASLGDRVERILDGGPCTVGIESTVVDCTTTPVRILRPGMVTREMLAQVLEPLGVSVVEASEGRVSHTASTVDADRAPRAPGMVDRHYAPSADVWLVDGDQTEALLEELRTALLGYLAAPRPAGGPPGVVALWRTLALAVPGVEVIRMPADPVGYAQRLYGALHAADAGGATLVVIERPPADGAGWAGVRDRLTRASR
jgi:L-threonylcarbamoyladenylate synthase